MNMQCGLVLVLVFSIINGAAAKGKADAAAEAAKALLGATKEVSGLFSSGASNQASVRWIGNLNYNVKTIHGKVASCGRDGRGGSVTVTKRNSAWIGAEHKVKLYKPHVKSAIAEVHLETFYSGSQPNVYLVYGHQHFVTKKVETNKNTILILSLI
jgi:hypothetical protein